MALSNSQYESIIRGYEKTRDQNRYLEQERKRIVYERIPELAALDDARTNFVLSYTASLLEGAFDDAPKAKADLSSIRAKRSELLRKAGYPEDYLSPIYTCPDCRDTGYITEDGIRTKCHCFRNQEIKLLYQQSNIQEYIEKNNFSTLTYEHCQGEDLEHLKGAVKVSLNFIKTFGTQENNLLFYGTVGTGKSFLSGCIARELLCQGYSVVYFSAINLFDTLARYSFDTKEKETLYNFCKDLYNNDLVIIDDLGTELTNSFVTSELFSLMNERQLNKKATIISTNLNLSELRDRYSDRVFSRITHSYQLCKLTGPDYRMYKKVH